MSHFNEQFSFLIRHVFFPGTNVRDAFITVVCVLCQFGVKGYCRIENKTYMSSEYHESRACTVWNECLEEC